MILAIESDLPTFKPVRLHEGLNVLLSDKSPRSGEKQTRNSAGKSSLVEIIHFLLGSKAGPELLLRNPALLQFTFRCTIQIGGDEITVARSGSDAGKILLDEEAAKRAGLKSRKHRETGLHYISNETWKEFLGHRMFGLPSPIKGSTYEELFAPRFRSLTCKIAAISGSARRRASGRITTFNVVDASRSNAARSISPRIAPFARRDFNRGYGLGPGLDDADQGAPRQPPAPHPLVIVPAFHLREHGGRELRSRSAVLRPTSSSHGDANVNRRCLTDAPRVRADMGSLTLFVSDKIL